MRGGFVGSRAASLRLGSMGFSRRARGPAAFVWDTAAGLDPEAWRRGGIGYSPGPLAAAGTGCRARVVMTRGSPWFGARLDHDPHGITPAFAILGNRCLAGQARSRGLVKGLPGGTATVIEDSA